MSDIPSAQLVDDPKFPSTGPTTSGKATASLILGLGSFFCFFFTGIPAIILGFLAKGDISKNAGRMGGGGMATAGIVLGILGTLWTIVLMIGMLLPAVTQVREAARISQTQNNLKQLMLSMLNYESVHREFPSPVPAEGSQSMLSWRVQILPYLEQQNLYDQFHHDEPWDSPHNLTLIESMPDVFKSPSYEQLEPGKTLMQVPITRLDINGESDQQTTTLFVPGQATTFGKIVDGSSNTIALMEVDPDAAVTWTQPQDWEFDPTDPTRSLGGIHQGRLIVAYADGSTRSMHVHESSPEDLNALFTRGGSEVVDSFSF